MKMRQRFGLLVCAAVLAALTAASLAGAAIIHEGKGPGQARLGQIDTSAALLLGKHGGLQRDPNYGSRVVYVVDFGTKKAGRFPCEMLSDSAHRVFQFAFNSPAYVTAKGIKVGSSEAALTAAYSGLRRTHTPKFDHYVWGKRPYTDFWVLNSTRRVYQVIVRSK
jgi:hypothetical protein